MTSQFSAPSLRLNHCWLAVIWTLWNKLEWNLNKKTITSLRENELENVADNITTALFYFGLIVIKNEL